MQTHRKISLSQRQRQRVSEDFAALYQKGLSISDIAEQTGKPKSTIRDALLRAGITLRTAVSQPATQSWKGDGKGSQRPPYGFCYFQGEVVPDQREYKNLLLIHRLWTEGVNPNAIADRLTSLKVPARNAPEWNRNSVLNILKRFENKSIVITGDRYELR